MQAYYSGNWGWHAQFHKQLLLICFIKNLANSIYSHFLPYRTEPLTSFLVCVGGGSRKRKVGLDGIVIDRQNVNGGGDRSL
jgi:hypothetical protein